MLILSLFISLSLRLPRTESKVLTGVVGLTSFNGSNLIGRILLCCGEWRMLPNFPRNDCNPLSKAFAYVDFH
jgi:hypothetical protein